MPERTFRPNLRARLRLVAAVATLAASFGVAASAVASEWPFWRGPDFDGVSEETGLISSWSLEGAKNLVWKDESFVGRSTPAVFDGRACAIGRTGEGIEMQETVACYDAASGKKLWENRHTVYQTTVAFNRLGWASVTGDPETGYLYSQGADGALDCFDRDGKQVWGRVLREEFGFYSGYGGRTQTPIVDGDLLLIAFVSSGWGETAPLRHRYHAFDKRSGALVWMAAPGGMPKDFNTQSVPVVAEIGGVRQLVVGGADGVIYGLNIGSGEKIWSFPLSKRGLNSSVVVHDGVVYASHSEENLDDGSMGRIVAFKAGKGELGKDAEIWRNDEISQGFPSPALADGTLYVVDNSANLHALDAATGKVRWMHSLGTVGKGSPELADGKLFVTEVNGRFHILAPSKQGVEVLDEDELSVADGRYAEIYGSPAIAYGKVYFTTEGGFYCLGERGGRVAPAADKPAARKASSGEPARIHVVPAEVWLRGNDQLQFEARAFDAAGHAVGPVDAKWTIDGISGMLSSRGKLKLFGASEVKTGTVTATVGALTATARVRLFPQLPWSEDFESFEEGVTPAHWLNASRKFVVGSLEGNKVLVKAPRERGLNRSWTYFGTPDMSNYTIQADVKGTRQGRRIPDMGLIAGGYTLDLMGAHQQLQIRSWDAMLRMATQVDFSWEMDTWYRMKLRVEVAGGKATVRGKVWPVGAEEPGAWTITAEDPLPVAAGSPGLVAYTPATGYYDNIRVTVNE